MSDGRRLRLVPLQVEEGLAMAMPGVEFVGFPAVGWRLVDDGSKCVFSVLRALQVFQREVETPHPIPGVALGQRVT